MLPYQETIRTVRAKLIDTLAQLDTYFNLPEPAYRYRPSNDAWSIQEILEHITLTSKYLLIVIQNSTQKCLKRAAHQAVELGESDLAQLAVIGHPDTFPWIRPEHMEPTGQLPLGEIRDRLQQQFTLCIKLLDQLQQGEGTLHKVRMSVQELGKLDVYQWMYFLALHAQRHSVEIERLDQAWQTLTK